MKNKDIVGTLWKKGEGFNDVLESFPDAVIIVGSDTRILIANRQFETMFGYDRSEIIGRSLNVLIPERFTDHHEYVGEYRRDLKIRRMRHTRESFAISRDGREFPVDIHLSPMEISGETAIIAVIRDISEQKKKEAMLDYHCNYDSLTGLPNRNLLEDRIGQSLLQAKRSQQQVAVLIVDLDNYKSYLTGLSRGVGDEVLQKIADRMKACVRENDTMARLGDEVFVLILDNMKVSEDAARVAQKLMASVRRSIEIGPRVCEITCSIGISIYPKDGGDVATLLRNADIAMFRAKEKGSNRFQFFTDDMNERITFRISMERCLRQAIGNNELSLHYQPQVDLKTGRIIGVEALLRWQNPDLGAVSPGQFIPLAEETGLIVPIGEWVLKTACMDNKRWQDEGYPYLPMAVNLSPRQFWDPGLVDYIRRILTESGLQPGYLELEITEGLVMRDVENALAMIHELKELGVQLSIDDFGTGYSSLSHLKRFPFDKLKLDISFVREITYDPGCAAIAKTIIALGHNLNLRVIAEGVETEGQLSYLRLLGCDEMQGFYFSKPLPAQDLEQLLTERRMLDLPEDSEGHSSRTLLLVDDEPMIILTIKRILHEEGYRVISTTNAIEGFEILATNQVGVILSDIRMPAMDGIEFLSKVSHIHPETVRIAMSGYADMKMVTEAINHGAIYKFLTKPIEIKILRQNLAIAFEQYEISAHRN